MRNVLQWVCLMQVVCSVVIVMLLSNQLIMVCCGFEWSFDVHVVAFPAFELIEFLSEVVAALPPSRRKTTSAETNTILKGLNLAIQETIIAVNPSPPTISSLIEC